MARSMFNLTGLAAALILGAVLFYAYGYFFRNSASEGFAGENSFTMYYADWCPHCQRVKPLFTQFMGSGTVTVKGTPVKVAMVSPEQNPDAAKGVPIKGYPTFILNKGGQLIEFNGERTAEGFKQFLESNL